MNIGILTFQNTNNSGALLQAYALQTVLNSQGHQAEIVNFVSDNDRNRNGKNPFKNKGKSYWARKVYNLFYNQDLKSRKVLFNQFRREYLVLNPVECISEKGLEVCTKKYDCLVCGSDQIWSQDPKMYDRSDAYFINFLYEGKRVSYAASFGDSLQYAEKEKDKLKDFLSKFDSISVREKAGQDFLNDCGLKSEVCVDPTILLSAETWDEIAVAPPFQDKYILYFSVNSRPYSINIAKKLGQMTGLKVIEINPHPKSWNSGFIKKYASGPREFLGYVKNAEYVVTNSFHGTVFSILFHKKGIIAFDMKDGKIIPEFRKMNLLELTGLKDLACTEATDLNTVCNTDVDWDVVDKKIDTLRKKSMEYLTGALK